MTSLWSKLFFLALYVPALVGIFAKLTYGFHLNQPLSRAGDYLVPGSFCLLASLLLAQPAWVLRTTYALLNRPAEGSAPGQLAMWRMIGLFYLVYIGVNFAGQFEAALGIAVGAAVANLVVWWLRRGEEGAVNE